MKPKIFKRKLSFTRHTALALLLVMTAIIIHSCKKDSSKTLANMDVAVAQAKTWYEGTYPATVFNNHQRQAEHTKY